MFLTLRLSQKAHIQHWEKNLTHISAMWEFMNVGNWKRITDKRSTCILRLLIFSESPAGFVLLLLPQREIFEYHRQASWVSNGHFKLYVGNVIWQSFLVSFFFFFFFLRKEMQSYGGWESHAYVLKHRLDLLQQKNGKGGNTILYL